MQESLDAWLESDWLPTISQDKEIQKKYMKKKRVTSQNSDTNNSEEQEVYVEDDDRPFTLQEYVDKADAYMRAKPNDYKHSHVHKVESLPVIGE